MTDESKQTDQSDATPTPQAAPPTVQGAVVSARPPEAWPGVIGVMSIVFGVLGILQNGCGAVMMLFVGSMESFVPQGQTSGMDVALESSLPYPGLLAVQYAAEFGLAILLLVGGIMLLSRRPGAARALITFAWLDLGVNTYTAVLQFYSMRAQMQAMQENPSLSQAPMGMFATITDAASSVILVIGWSLVAIWPIFLLVWFHRRKIRDTVGSWR